MTSVISAPSSFLLLYFRTPPELVCGYRFFHIVISRRWTYLYSLVANLLRLRLGKKYDMTPFSRFV